MYGVFSYIWLIFMVTVNNWSFFRGSCTKNKDGTNEGAGTNEGFRAYLVDVLSSLQGLSRADHDPPRDLAIFERVAR